MVGVQRLSEGFVSCSVVARICMSFDIPFSSYWTWLILGTLVVVTQLLGVTEKLWIKVGPLNLQATC